MCCFGGMESGLVVEGSSPVNRVAPVEAEVQNEVFQPATVRGRTMPPPSALPVTRPSTGMPPFALLFGVIRCRGLPDPALALLFPPFCISPTTISTTVARCFFAQPVPRLGWPPFPADMLALHAMPGPCATHTAPGPQLHVCMFDKGLCITPWTAGILEPQARACACQGCRGARGNDRLVAALLPDLHVLLPGGTFPSPASRAWPGH